MQGRHRSGSLKLVMDGLLCLYHRKRDKFGSSDVPSPQGVLFTVIGIQPIESNTGHTSNYPLYLFKLSLALEVSTLEFQGDQSHCDTVPWHRSLENPFSSSAHECTSSTTNASRKKGTRSSLNGEEGDAHKDTTMGRRGQFVNGTAHVTRTRCRVLAGSRLR